MEQERKKSSQKPHSILFLLKRASKRGRGVFCVNYCVTTLKVLPGLPEDRAYIHPSLSAAVLLKVVIKLILCLNSSIFKTLSVKKERNLLRTHILTISRRHILSKHCQSYNKIGLRMVSRLMYLKFE